MKFLYAFPSLLLVCALSACSGSRSIEIEQPGSVEDLSLRDMAKVFSCLPLAQEHLNEVHSAVNSSSGNGYDEEYMMRDLLEAPGCGVGSDAATKARAVASASRPIRALLEDYYSSHLATKAGAADVQAWLDGLSESDMQIYWPYSEDWNGEEYPIITFDPGYGAQSNYGYELRMGEDGKMAVDSVYVDENVAKSRPVWVINRNDDSSYTPLEMFLPQTRASVRENAGTSLGKTLYLKSFKMLRNYDSWFGGASEFWVKCGAVKDFHATTEAEMKLYSPAVTDFMIVVKRSQIGKEVPFDCILMTGFTDQLEQIAFMVTEDDGGTQTSWKCTAVVKVSSKSYGVELDIPYHEKDDIVWRGQLNTAFFQEKNEVVGRFGDVMLTFALL